ncbi:sulfite exporter TauE/SafE family protein [Zoogloea sp.]|uniref:sulfite exporter TauE/SafE family protein n=1 Tax=Zoogloea sp. TaxID=49181 RepID=UPI0026082AB0|nr:sulfite exporter TauE/SafE family protein [Zoogloea sp.]
MFTGIALGSIVGMLLGLTGAGGGVLAVPVLMLGLGMSMTEATPVALIAVGSAAWLGGLAGLRQGLVRYRAALLMACLGALSAPVGVSLAHRLSPAVLVAVFCAVLCLIAFRMLGAASAGAHDPESGHLDRNCMINPATGRFRWNLRCSTTLAATGSLAGLFTGMLGVGGGFLIVPAFRQYSDLTMAASAATSLAVIALVSSTTVLGSLLGGAEISALGWVFIAATGVGMIAGRSVAIRIPGRWLQIGFAGAVLLVATVWLAKTFF